MGKRFLVTCALVVTLAVWCGLAAAEQDKQQGSAPNAPASSSGNGSAQNSTPSDIPTPDDPAADTKAAPRAKQPDTAKQQTKGDKRSDSPNVRENRPPRSDDPNPSSENADATPPPMKQGESSSKDTKIDLTPPVGDANEHPDSSPDPEAGPTEFHAWDPHRAMKNVEVGDYYYKRGNYRAAISRYQEALQWKPKDAEATFKLADAYDKVGDFIDAKDNYQKYLKILPKGPRAEEANKALARLETK